MSVLESTAGRRSRPRPPRAARRVGYAVGAFVNGVLLWLVNVAPGWQAVPFLTSDFTDVLGLVNASIVAGLLAHVLYLVVDPPWLRSAGDLVVTSVGLVATVAVLRSFPFTFAGQSFDWEPVVRVLLWLGIVGSAIGIVAALVTLLTRRWRPA